MSKLTDSPPTRRSKSSELDRPSLWKKYSLPSGELMKPKPRSEMTFLMVPLVTVMFLDVSPRTRYGARPAREGTVDQAKTIGKSGGCPQATTDRRQGTKRPPRDGTSTVESRSP